MEDGDDRLGCTLGDGHPGLHHDEEGAYWTPVEPVEEQHKIDPKVWMDRPDDRALVAQAKALYARVRADALALDLDADPADWPEWDRLSRRERTMMLALAHDPGLPGS